MWSTPVPTTLRATTPSAAGWSTTPASPSSATLAWPAWAVAGSATPAPSGLLDVRKTGSDARFGPNKSPHVLGSPVTAPDNARALSVFVLRSYLRLEPRRLQIMCPFFMTVPGGGKPTYSRCFCTQHAPAERVLNPNCGPQKCGPVGDRKTEVRFAVPDVEKTTGGRPE